MQRDAEVAIPYGKDTQVNGIHNARRFLGDRLTRVAAPHRILDPAAGPLIAVRLHIITQDPRGHPDRPGRPRPRRQRRPGPGPYAAGEAAGFGGGGDHGYNALEGTFLGGCIFTGRTAGRSLARSL